jgi:hypothetical protein
MRYILIILLFCSGSTKAQMVIKAHPNYRPLSVFRGILDDYPNAVAAYSLRKLDNDYTGAAIRVRKDTTGQPESDINFDASGNLDTSQLKQFLNLRNGFVTTWYDQSGNSRNATRTVQADQPQIASLGVIIRTNGKVAIQSVDDFLQTASLFTFTHAFTLGKINNFATINYIVGSTSVGLWYGGNSATAQGLGAFDGTNTRGITGEDLNRHLGWYSMRGGRLYVARDGQTETNTGTFAASLSINVLFGRNVLGGTFLQGNIQELIFYNSDQSSNRTGIDANINAYYGIY